jgi:hypothetical protein
MKVEPHFALESPSLLPLLCGESLGRIEARPHIVDSRSTTKNGSLWFKTVALEQRIKTTWIA